MCCYKCDSLLLLRFIVVVINDLCHCSDCYHPSPFALCCHSYLIPIFGIILSHHLCYGSHSPPSVFTVHVVFIHFFSSLHIVPILGILSHLRSIFFCLSFCHHCLSSTIFPSPSCPFHLHLLHPVTLSILLSGAHCYFPNCYVCIHYNKTHLY